MGGRRGRSRRKKQKQRETEGNREEEEVEYRILRGSLFEEEVKDGEAGMEKKMEGWYRLEVCGVAGYIGDNLGRLDVLNLHCVEVKIRVNQSGGYRSCSRPTLPKMVLLWISERVDG